MGGGAGGAREAHLLGDGGVAAALAALHGELEVLEQPFAEARVGLDVFSGEEVAHLKQWEARRELWRRRAESLCGSPHRQRKSRTALSWRRTPCRCRSNFESTEAMFPMTRA